MNITALVANVIQLVIILAIFFIRGLDLGALVIFMLTFAAVAIRVLRRGGSDPDHLRLAQLPLADDTGTPTPTREEARHG